MNLIEFLPVWQLALVVFGLRVVDVAIGTVRTLSVLRGRVVFTTVEPVIQTRPTLYPPLPYFGSLRTQFIRK